MGTYKTYREKKIVLGSGWSFPWRRTGKKLHGYNAPWPKSRPINTNGRIHITGISPVDKSGKRGRASDK